MSPFYKLQPLPAPAVPKFASKLSKKRLTTVLWVDSSRENTYDISVLREDLMREDLMREDLMREDLMREDLMREDLMRADLLWNDELRSIEATLERDLADPVSAPPNYLEVLEAGEGVQGTVIFCLPKYYAVAAKYAMRKGTPYTVAELKSKLVAVKVSWGREVEKAQNEVRVYEFLAERIRAFPHESIPPFASLRAHSSTIVPDAWISRDAEQPAKVPVGAKYWMVMDAMNMTVIDLWENYSDKFGRLGDILLLHVFCHVMEALRFLHSCNPPLTHGDIHGGNVMLKLTNGLPRVILGDFGMTSPILGDHDAREADYELLHLLFKWMCSNYNDHSEGSKQFRRALIDTEEPRSWEALIRDAEPLARSTLETITPETEAEVANFLFTVSRVQEDKLLRKLELMGLVRSFEDSKDAL